MEKIRWKGREDGGRGAVGGRRERNERKKAGMRGGEERGGERMTGKEGNGDKRREEKDRPFSHHRVEPAVAESREPYHPTHPVTLRVITNPQSEVAASTPPPPRCHFHCCAQSFLRSEDTNTYLVISR